MREREIEKERHESNDSEAWGCAVKRIGVNCSDGNKCRWRWCVEEDHEFVWGLENFERPLRHVHGDTDEAGVQVRLKK